MVKMRPIPSAELVYTYICDLPEVSEFATGPAAHTAVDILMEYYKNLTATTVALALQSFGLPNQRATPRGGLSKISTQIERQRPHMSFATRPAHGFMPPLGECEPRNPGLKA